MTMRARSLFSGVGGVDLGLERAGMEIVSQCELEPYRREILRRHWPETEISDDVTTVSYPAGSADLLCGGFPCQDLSVAGRRKGLDGARSGLFFEFARIADECVPEGGWILIENVPGLLSSKGGRDFGVLLRTLVDLGFCDIAWRVLDSRYFGVPQRRRRVFILARRAAGQRAGKVLLEPEGDGGHPQEGRKKGKKRPRAAADGAGGGGPSALDGAGGEEATGGSAAANGLTRRYGKGTDSDATDAMVITNALDRMRGGADDNDAQANHIVPVGLGKDTDVSGTLGKKGVGGGGLGLDREGAMVVERSAGFNWQSGGDVRLQVKEGESPTLQTQQVPAVIIVAPEVAAPLTRGHAASEGVSAPGRRMEDDKNIVGILGDKSHALTSEGMDASEDGTGRGTPIIAFGAWNMRELSDGVSGTLLGGTKGAQYSLNNMPLVAKCLTSNERWDLDTEDFVVHAPDEAHTLRQNPRNNSDPSAEMNMHIMVRGPGVGTRDPIAFQSIGGSRFLDESSETSPTLKVGSGLGIPSPPAVVLFNPFRTSLGRGEGYVEGWKPDTIHDAVTKQDPPKGRPVVVSAKSVRENQRGEVDETDATYAINKAGGKPGQGYAAARIVTSSSVPAGLVRRLTPTECERLQGFPDGWTTLEEGSLAGESSWYEVRVVRGPDGTAIVVPRMSDPAYLDRMVASMMGGYEVDEPKPDGRRYAAMGDAVTVPVAHWIGARLLEFGDS